MSHHLFTGTLHQSSLHISGPLSFILRSGVQLPPVTQVRLLGMASHSAHLSDSCNNESAVGLTTQRPVASPNRRLRFEDETEMEAESRYQERQRRRAGIWRTGVSKPDLNLYICDRMVPESQVVGQPHTCRAGSGQRSNMSQHPHVSDDRGWGLYQSNLNLRTEPIRETYIGSVIPGVTRGGGAMCVSNIQVRRRDNHMALNITDLPVNPYAPNQLATLTSRCSSTSRPPPMTSSMTPPTVRLNGRKAGQDQEVLGGPAGAQPHRDLRSGAEVTERKNSVSSCLPAQTELTMMSQRRSESPGQNI